MELVKSLGANKVIDYTEEDSTKDEEEYSSVLDTVGKSSFAKCKPLLRPGGVYISSDLGYMAQNIFLPRYNTDYKTNDREQEDRISISYRH
jgi:NADPH:quinone reductase-like Zn-dependent oxidoreductase